MQRKPNGDYVEALKKALAAQSPQVVAQLLIGAHPAEVADALEALPRHSRLDLWQQVIVSHKGEVLLEVHGEVRQQLVEATEESVLLRAILSLEVDELADLDEDLPATVVDAMVKTMDTRQRERYEVVRSYPDNTAGGLMDVDAMVVSRDLTLKAVLSYLRERRRVDGKLPEHLDSLMVVSGGDQYLGVLRLSDVVSLDGEMLVGEAMVVGVPAIPALTTATKVARLFEDKDLLSAPVVSEGGHLLGRITVDDVVDVMRGQADHEVMVRAGLTQATDMFAPIVSSASRRAVWLGVNLVNALLAAWVIGLFEGSIDKIVALAVLMPVVASMGGVAGNQTLTLITRGLALEQVRRSNALNLLFREVAQGLLNGMIWAVVVAIVAVLWFNDLQLGLVFGVALILNLLTGAVMGTIAPLALQRLGIDPALAGGVVLTAVTDVVGFLSFLGLATLFLF